MAKPDMKKRGLLAALFGAPAIVAVEAVAQTRVADTPMRGSLAASRLLADTAGDQSTAFRELLKQSSDTNTPLLLPAGTFVVSGIDLPPIVRFSGVRGATRLIYGGENGFFIRGFGCALIAIDNIIFDGANRWLGDEASGLLSLSDCSDLRVTDCRFENSSRSGVALRNCAGVVSASSFTTATDAGIFSVDAAGLSLTGNVVADCGNCGILVHRSAASEDRTIVSGNRINRIAARDGGTGQNGNGINIFRASRVQVSNNTIADCAFSAIRGNSASNIAITGNTCLRSGETAIYSEFAFEGAVVSNNIVDGAANGISLVNFDQGGRLSSCANNIVRNLSTSGPYRTEPPGFGIGIAAEADAAITGNVVEGAPVYGIALGWGPFMRNIAATGNVVRDCREGIVVSVADGAGTATITGNTIDNAPEGAITAHRWVERAAILADGDTTFPNIHVANNGMVGGR